MAYSDLDVDIVYVGDGVTDTFPINFAFTNEEYVKVELWDVTDPDNPVQQSYVLDSDYEISGTDVIASTIPTADQKLLVYRESEPAHGTNYTEYAFPYDIVNTDLDKVYQLAQENRRWLERTISNPQFNTLSGNGTTITFSEVADAVENSVNFEAEILNLQNQITANDGDIATNVGDIAALDSRVGDNESDITDLQADFASLAPTVMVSITAAATHVAANAEIIIIDTADVVEVQLPAPVAGHTVVAKIASDVADKTITSGANIDAFGGTFTFTSAYEAVKLVSDGTNWFII